MERKNKLAMVTGGSGGIGLELAKQFTDHGFDVAISGQSDRVHESAEALRAKGVEAHPIKPTRAPTMAWKDSGDSSRTWGVP